MKLMLIGWVKRKIILPLKNSIKDGISIERLSVSLALGITIGLIPLYGVTTLLVGAVALSLRLNFVAMQIAHYIVHPVQIALLIPFMKAGDSMVKGSEVSFSVQQYIQLFRTDFWAALKDLWLINLLAIAVWLVISIPLFLGLYYLLMKVIRHYFPNLGYLRA